MKSLTDLPGKILAFSDSCDLLPQGCTVLCALSGGADSMALVSGLLALAEERSLTVLAAHYDHQLRGEESRRDADFVRSWCAARGIPLTMGTGDVAARAAQTGKGIEETARAMRYAFLEETAQALGAHAIATAHNADDNAETVLLHLIRGTGLDGLSGIPPRRGTIIRPLLSVTRQEIEDWLTARDIPWVTDSTNADPTYTRNRIRRDVMPVLRDLNPQFSQTLAANLRHIREDRALLDGLARTTQAPMEEPDGLSLAASDLIGLPRPVAVRAIKQVLARLDRHQISAVHLDSILDLAAKESPSAQITLPQGLLVRRVYDRVVFSQGACPAQPLTPRAVHQTGQYSWGDWTITLEEAPCPDHPLQSPYDCWLRPAPFPLLLRSRRTGDSLRLPGRSRKTLKKWHIEAKIPRHLRDGLPLLTDGEDQLLAAAGLGPDEAHTAQPGQPALHVRFSNL
ncbi:MAG: tRNA lysidine(34) synthetase TilS [Ruminiclostridium sp.]|nr:tRNA lysidine(34) synthetase TilS [Ruminiclostridium sp.]MBQ9933484.1 tRNA lysidine(34) synthetase TilS [Ruminiclostridium sp.]